MQEPSLTLKMKILRSVITSKPRVAKCLQSGHSKTQFVHLICSFTGELEPERTQISTLSDTQHFYVESLTFCSCLTAFSCSSLRIQRHPAGTVISVPSLCSSWLVSRLCLNSDTCTRALFWAWDWKLQWQGLSTGRWVPSFLFSFLFFHSPMLVVPTLLGHAVRGDVRMWLCAVFISERR